MNLGSIEEFLRYLRAADSLQEEIEKARLMGSPTLPSQDFLISQSLLASTPFISLESLQDLVYQAIYYLEAQILSLGLEVLNQTRLSRMEVALLLLTPRQRRYAILEQRGSDIYDIARRQGGMRVMCQDTLDRTNQKLSQPLLQDYIHNKRVVSETEFLEWLRP